MAPKYCKYSGSEMEQLDWVLLVAPTCCNNSCKGSLITIILGTKCIVYLYKYICRYTCISDPVQIYYIYVYMNQAATRLATFHLKVLMWGAGSLFEAVGWLSSFSWTFASPARCHPSILPVLFSGIFAGFGLGLAFSIWIWWTFASYFRPSQSFPSPSRERHHPRLSAYLHGRAAHPPGTQ